MKGSCNRRCCFSPFVDCIRNGECACHREYRSPFQVLVEEAAKQEEES